MFPLIELINITSYVTSVNVIISVITIRKLLVSVLIEALKLSLHTVLMTYKV